MLDLKSEQLYWAVFPSKKKNLTSFADIYYKELPVLNQAI